MFLRKNVGLLIFNSQKLIFSGERSDIIGAWQMPQGGIEAGESPQESAIRELSEETGIKNNFKIIKHSRQNYEYFKPIIREGIPYDGQIQTWFLIEFFGSDKEIQIGEEFINWNWLNKETLLEKAISFKKSIYEQVFTEFNDFLS